MPTQQDPHPASADHVTLAVVGGLLPGGKLRENRMVDLTPSGLRFYGALSWEQWRDLVRAWRMMRDGSMKILADLLRHGHEQFGSERVAVAMEQLELNLDDVNRASAIGSLPLSIRERHPELTGEQLYVLAHTPGPDGDPLPEAEQEKWAGQAADLTAIELKHSIAAGRLTRTTPAAARDVLNTAPGFARIFDAWFRRNDEQIATWPETKRRELWEELRGPTVVGLQLAKSLGIPVEEITR